MSEDGLDRVKAESEYSFAVSSKGNNQEKHKGGLSQKLKITFWKFLDGIQKYKTVIVASLVLIVVGCAGFGIWTKWKTDNMNKTAVMAEIKNLKENYFEEVELGDDGLAAQEGLSKIAEHINMVAGDDDRKRMLRLCELVWQSESDVEKKLSLSYMDLSLMNSLKTPYADMLPVIEWQIDPNNVGDSEAAQYSAFAAGFVYALDYVSSVERRDEAVKYSGLAVSLAEKTGNEDYADAYKKQKEFYESGE